MTEKRRVGRPNLSDEVAAQEAARVIEVATALRYGPSRLAVLGFTSESEARQYVRKRHRGRIGEFVGDSVRNLLYPAENRTQLAVSLVLDHGLTRYRAAKAAKVDLTNLSNALLAGLVERRAAARRRGAMLPKLHRRDFLPINTTV